jgi:hypothetical protein
MPTGRPIVPWPIRPGRIGFSIRAGRMVCHDVSVGRVVRFQPRLGALARGSFVLALRADASVKAFLTVFQNSVQNVAIFRDGRLGR